MNGLHDSVGFSKVEGYKRPEERLHTEADNGKQFTDIYGRKYTFVYKVGRVY